MSNYDVITNCPVVIDNGSGVIKAGFAGEQAPKVRFANYVGRTMDTRVMAGSYDGNQFIGSKAEEYRGLLSIKYPMEHGIVTDWADMERVWQYLYSKEQLHVRSDEHPVLLTERPLNPLKNREKAAEIFFESFNTPALHIEMQAVLSLYSAGRTTGVVLDSGDGVTHVVPIFEGFLLENGIERIDVGGRDVTRLLRLLLRKEGADISRTSEFEVVREIKEKACYIAASTAEEEDPENDKLHYALPDGSRLDIGASRVRAPEVLFRPELIGTKYPGIAQLVHSSLSNCDIELRKELYENIVLSGGSTLFGGFDDRLLVEIRKLAPDWDCQIAASAPQDRLDSAWIGGSIIASLENFRKKWVSRQEYDEEGENVIRKKFF